MASEHRIDSDTPVRLRSQPGYDLPDVRSAVVPRSAVALRIDYAARRLRLLAHGHMNDGEPAQRERSDVRQIYPQQIGPFGPADPLGAAGPLQPGDTAADDLVAALADIYAYPDVAGRPWVRANFVASIDGAVTAEGRSGGLSGPADRLVFTLLRSLADVVVAGAGTVRAERYRQAQPGELWHQVRAGRPPAPPVAVITRRLDLELSDRLFGQGQDLARTIVLTTELAGEQRLKEASRVAEVVVAGATEMMTAQAIVEALVARGHRRILVEGGPMLLGQLVAEHLLDELCLTVSPVLEGGHEAGRLTSRRGPAGLTDMKLASVLEDDGFLLTRYIRA